MAARRGVGRVHDLDARLSWLRRLWAEGVMKSQFRPGVENNRFDFAFEKCTSSTTNEFIELELTDGGNESPRRSRGSKRLSCVNLEREEHMRDEWLVPDLCGNGHPAGSRNATARNETGELRHMK